MSVEEEPIEILLVGVLDELQDQMCQLITEYVPPYDKLLSWAVDRNADRETAEAKIIPLEEVDNLFMEYGCTICDVGMRIPGMKLTDCPPQAWTGTRVSIQTTECRKGGGEAIGAYHTHPFVLPIPSTGDIENHFRQGRLVDFIGGRVGRRNVLIGYGANEYGQMKYEMNQKIDPFPGDIWEGTSELVRLQVRPPGSRWVEGSERVRAFPVYDEVTVLQQFGRQFEFLKRFFEVVVRWC